MTAELPKGFHDPLTNSRVAQLHSEIQRLAHSSPPIAGREARIRELKAAIGMLRDYQFGFTSLKWFLSVYRSMAGRFVVTAIVFFLLGIVVSASLGIGEQNENSIGLLVEYGEFRLLLPGDAHQKEWDWWLQSQPNLLKRVQVHKASHHGSSNGDTAAALSRLMPETVVISVGGNNPYGHPNPATLALYRSAAVYRTDLHGTIVIEAERSGKYAVRTERGEGPRPPPVTSSTSTSGTSVKFASTCIDLNSANVRELQHIVHVGEVRARQIIALRNVQLFRSVQDLTRVDGIASARLRDIIAEGKACVRP